MCGEDEGSCFNLTCGVDCSQGPDYYYEDACGNCGNPSNFYPDINGAYCELNSIDTCGVCCGGCNTDCCSANLGCGSNFDGCGDCSFFGGNVYPTTDYFGNSCCSSNIVYNFWGNPTCNGNSNDGVTCTDLGSACGEDNNGCIYTDYCGDCGGTAQNDCECNGYGYDNYGTCCYYGTISCDGVCDSGAVEDNCFSCGGSCFDACVGGFCGCETADYDYFGNYCCVTDMIPTAFGNNLCNIGYFGTCSDFDNACGEDTTGCLYTACDGSCTSRTLTLYPNCPEPSSINPTVLQAYKLGILPIPSNNPAIKNRLLAEINNFPLILKASTPVIGGDNPANAAEPNATAWVLMDGPWYNTPNVPSSGFVGGQSWRKMAPIGYAPYGRETYVYPSGDEVVRYETGVWLYLNNNIGEIARAYGEAEYPWLATWNNGFRAGKITGSYNKLENYPSYL
jgi:hypothetical protein